LLPCPEQLHIPSSAKGNFELRLIHEGAGGEVVSLDGEARSYQVPPGWHSLPHQQKGDGPAEGEANHCKRLASKLA
jgi:hypothetical protein